MVKGTSFGLRAVLADECCDPECDEQADPDYPVSLCSRHVFLVVKRYLAQLATIQQNDPVLYEAIRAGRTDPEPKRRRKPRHVVYFVRFGDRVKIGTSGNLAERLLVIPHDEVIGTIPGDVKVERQWHLVWADHRIVGEWFQATPELLAAIHQALTEAA
jgi:hypothetical protein